MAETETPLDADDSAVLRQARERMASGDLAQTVELLSALVMRATALFEPYHELAVIAADQGDPATAIELLQLALQRRPASAEARRLLATLQGEARLHEDALAVLGPNFRDGAASAEDYNLVRELLGQSPPLSSVAWIRLVQDLKSLPPEQRQRLDDADRLFTHNNNLEQENQRLRHLLEKIRQNRAENSSADALPEHLMADMANALSQEGDDKPGASLPPNFCILPWTHLNINAHGDALLCCQGASLADDQGRPMNVNHHSLRAIWNGPAMRLVRSAMLAGVRVPGCSKCWQVEDRGGLSRRQESNAHLSRDHLRSIRDQASKNYYALPDLPKDYQLDMGNACNLKCRSCSSHSSSKIAADPVSLAWEASGAYPRSPLRKPSRETTDAADKQAPPSPHKAWYDNQDFLFGDLLAKPKQLHRLHVIGGEPLAAKQFQPMLEYLRTQGSPDCTSIEITTNGTLLNASLMQTMSAFGRVSVSLSFDGLGKHFEYLRYPGKWDEFLRNLQHYKDMKIALSAIPTFQAYNALNFTELLRFCEEHQLRLILNPLREPSFLAASILPPTARRVARERLLAYRTETCNPATQRMADSLISELAAPDAAFDPELFRTFMLYTNDLDTSRQNSSSFAELHGELLNLVAQDGIDWSHETRFA